MSTLGATLKYQGGGANESMSLFITTLWDNSEVCSAHSPIGSQMDQLPKVEILTYSLSFPSFLSHSLSCISWGHLPNR